MNVPTAGLDRTRRYVGIGLLWWCFVAVLVPNAAPACAGEERAAVTATVPPGKATAERAVSAGSLRPGPNRIASARQALKPRLVVKTAAGSANRDSAAISSETPIERAIRTIAESQARYDAVEDYTCTLYKRERIAGRMTPLHIMAMKARTKPSSIYLKFERPARGREAIYIAGRHDGKLMAHDVGLNKFLAGTLQLEPTSSRAMADCRHPITEAGIGPLLMTLAKRWAVELNPEHSKLIFDEMTVGPARCTMIESTHPHRRPEFLHYRVRVFIDQELGLPIRFEAYDWPKSPHSEPDLLEEYSYIDLKLNVGLRDVDFDVSNSEYSFGRF